jgi:hypothetical protein
MKHFAFLLLIGICFFSCSTNNNGTVTVVPLAPTNLTGSAISTAQINLTWTDNATNEDGYKIERKTGTGSYAVVGSTASNMTTFSDLGLTPNTSYTYRVYAYNSAGNSLQYSNELTLSTQDSIPSWLTNGLVAYYPFNGNANDESGNGNNGTVNGATLAADRFGDTNKAYSFNGTSDFITIPHSASLALQNNITISVWKKSFGNTGNYETYLTKRDGNGNWNYSLGASHYYGQGGCSGEVNKYLTARRNNGGAQYELRYTDSLVTPSVNNWSHIVAVIENNVVSFYINGNPTGTSCYGNQFTIPSIDTGAPLTMGSCNCGLSEYFNGILDDIRIYNRALSASEVAYLASH